MSVFWREKNYDMASYYVTTSVCVFGGGVCVCFEYILSLNLNIFLQ